MPKKYNKESEKLLNEWKRLYHKEDQITSKKFSQRDTEESIPITIAIGRFLMFLTIILGLAYFFYPVVFLQIVGIFR